MRDWHWHWALQGDPGWRHSRGWGGMRSETGNVSCVVFRRVILIITTAHSVCVDMYLIQFLLYRVAHGCFFVKKMNSKYLSLCGPKGLSTLPL